MFRVMQIRKGWIEIAGIYCSQTKLPTEELKIITVAKIVLQNASNETIFSKIFLQNVSKEDDSCMF